MTRIAWTPQALEDVEAIRAHVARDSPRYAAFLAERLLAAVERLERHPRSGRMVPEFRDESLREVILGRYRIIHRVRPEVVEILTVLHGARLLRP